MNITVEIDIAKPKEAIWKAITDFENCANMISSILKIQVLHKPVDTLVGLKWEETRQMLGKEAKETMWITEASENEYYCTRAENCGTVYISRLALKDSENGALLKMSFSGQPLSVGAKIMSLLMMPFFKGSIKKALLQDLQDIRTYLENSYPENS